RRLPGPVGVDELLDELVDQLLSFDVGMLMLLLLEMRQQCANELISGRERPGRRKRGLCLLWATRTLEGASFVAPGDGCERVGMVRGLEIAERGVRVPLGLLHPGEVVEVLRVLPCEVRGLFARDRELALGFVELTTPGRYPPTNRVGVGVIAGRLRQAVGF